MRAGFRIDVLGMFLIVLMIGRTAWAEDKSFPNSLEMELVLITAGEFQMGGKLSPTEVATKYGGNANRYKNEHPRHRVTLSKPFYLAAHEVTVGQFRRFVEATGYKTDAEKGGQGFEDGKKGGLGYGKDGKWGWREDLSWRNPGFEQGDNHPVVQVSWNDAVAFCKWLSRKEGRDYRLPTEAQWEYACRGGTDTVFWWGNPTDTTGTVANVSDTGHWKASGGIFNMEMNDGFQYTAPVGRYGTNRFGLYDMTGNVWEWCQDWYGQYDSDKQTDPTGPSTGKARVLRGGAWHDSANTCRCSNRDGNFPAYRYSDGGFRVSLGTR